MHCTAIKSSRADRGYHWSPCRAQASPVPIASAAAGSAAREGLMGLLLQAGKGGRTRTYDTMDQNHVLYQLSYTPPSSVMTAEEMRAAFRLAHPQDTLQSPRLMALPKQATKESFSILSAPEPWALPACLA